jgi:uncharacterized membrane protein
MPMPANKHLKWLQGELPQWVQQQVISQDQADSITRYYQQRSSSNAGRSIFSAIGAILFGLGIILFFAYNWQDMHRFLKLSIIFACIISANLGALWFAAPARRQHAASEGLALLGTLLFGAAIWLISQIYHIDEHYPNAFWLWGAAALAMGWARQSALQCLAAIVLLFSWGCMEIFSYDQWYHNSPWWLLLGTASLAWVLRSSWLLFLSIAAFYFLWVASLIEPLDDVAGYLVMAISVLLAQTGMMSERIKSPQTWNVRNALAIPGFLAYLAIVFIHTFEDFHYNTQYIYPFDSALQNSFFWYSLIISFTLPLLALLPLRQLHSPAETDRIHSVLMLASVAVVFIISAGWVEPSYGIRSSIMNLVFIAHCFLFILHGSQQQRGWEVAGGCLLFSALVFARYTDLFDSLLSRSLVFLVLGAGLFLVGNFYSRHKKDIAQHTAQGGNAA